MRRDEYVELLHSNRREALLWLSDAVFDSYDEDDHRTLWRRFHTGEITFESMSRWRPEAILAVADDYDVWDEEQEKPGND